MSANPPRASIVGLGMTELGPVYGRTAMDFASEAVMLAASDAGMDLHDLDGLLVNPGISGNLSVKLQQRLGLPDLRLLSEVQAFGSSAGIMVQMASLAIEAGMATAVACVFADAPLQPGRSAGSTYAGTSRPPTGFDALSQAAGLRSAPARYAMAARRHMECYGTTSEQLGAVAVATRAWATMNDSAQMRDPITLQDHQTARVIADPLRLYDCCLVSNGGIAVVVTSSERARDLAHPPIHVLGWGQAHPGYRMHRDSEFGLVCGAARSGPAALDMAGVALEEVDLRQLYDCFTYTTLITLEDYGFCKKGEGGDFVESGALGPGGSHPTNTGGGQLSSYYMWGMTPLSEAVMQTRGEAGDRQVDRHDITIVSGNGGVLDHHSTLVLGSVDTA